MQKPYLIIYTGVLALFLTSALFLSSKKDPNNSPAKTANSNSLKSHNTERLPQVIKSIDLNKDFSFAGEPVPMDNFDAKERLDRELSVNSYWHSSTILNIKRTSRYFPVIERILAKNGVPDDFKYLAVAESSLSNVSSPAGARGIWQIMKRTGQAHGLEINSAIDERYHLEKATKVACQILKKYKQRFGSWTLAAAAYNIGETKLSKTIKEQRAHSYYDLNLGSETSRYVFRIIALKEILTNPDNFGFYVEETDKYPELNNYSTVKITHTISDLGKFAEKYNISYRMLKIYNPWLRKATLPDKSGRVYYVKIPK